MYKFMKSLGVVAVFAYLSLIFAGIYFWVVNLMHVVNHHEVMDVELIVRLVGIFLAPLGALMGFTY